MPKRMLSVWRSSGSSCLSFSSNTKHFHTGQSLQKQRFTNHNWNDEKFCNSKYLKSYGLVPAYLILALLGIRDVLCKEEKESNKHLENDDASRNTEEKSSTHGKSKEVEETIKKKVYSEESQEKDANLTRRPHIKDNVSQRDIDLQPLPNFKNFTTRGALSLKVAIDISRSFLRKKLNETGAPGMAVSVSVNGRNVWSEGIGYSDLENGVLMRPNTIMRIASISKSLTMVAVAQLVEEGKLDLDAPIQKYVPSFPKKEVNGEEVTITTRHLLSHTSGIRHYKLKDENDTKKKDPSTNEESQSEEESVSRMAKTTEEKLKRLREIVAQKSFKTKNRKSDKEDEFDLKEYYIKERFESVKESLKLFQDDELLFAPGSDYYYTTHGFTLVSAVVESAVGKPFEKLMVELFRKLDMQDTYLDESEPIIYNRARYYTCDSRGRLKNAPYVDNSYKWAGGGFLSTTGDLINFGNLMLYSYQNTNGTGPKGFLKASTVKEIWTPVIKRKSKSGRDDYYGLGWGIVEGDNSPKAFAYNQRFCVSHSGGAIGASSILLVMPTYDPHTGNVLSSGNMDVPLPQGIVVSIITNMQGVGLLEAAVNIARTFDRVPYNPKVVGNISQIFDRKVYGLESS